MKTMLTAVLALTLAGPDYAKMLGEAKLSLSEAIDRGLKEAGGGTVVKAEIEREHGKTLFTMDIAQDAKIQEINLNVKDGTLADRETENEDASAVVKAFKISIKQAIDAVVAKTGGSAVETELVVKGDKAEVVVKAWKDGKIVLAHVDGQKGDVLSVGEKAGPAEGAKKAGFLGVMGKDSDGGVQIVKLVANAPAVKAGLQPDDVIVTVNGTKVKTLKELAELCVKLGAGGQVKIEYRHGEKTSEVTVTLAARPAGDEDGEEGEDGEDD